MATAFNLTARLNVAGPFGVNNVASKLRKQLGNITATVRVGVDPQAVARLNALNNALAQTEARLRAIKSLGGSFNTAMKGIGSAANKANKASQGFASGAANSNAVLAKTARGAAEASSEMQEFGRVSGLAIRRFAGFTIATTVIFGFIGAIKTATSEAIKFERELVRIAQVRNTTVQALGSLSDEVTRLATTFGVSSTALIGASRTLSQAGFSITETRKALEALAKTDLAPTFKNIETTTEGAIAAVRQFKLDVSELDSVLGSINAVAGQFAVESDDIINAIRRTGGVFAAAAGDIQTGQESLQQFIALFTSIRATTRESGESIATGLRTIFTRIQRRGTIEALEDLGIELRDVEGKFVGPFEAIRELSKELNNLDSRDIRFSQILEQLGGFRQIGKTIPLIKNFETAQKALIVAQEGVNSTSRDAEKAQQSLQVQFTKTKEEFLALIRETTQTDTFQTIAKGVLFLANTLITLAKSIKPILPLLAAFAAFKTAQIGSSFLRGFRGGIGSGGGSPGGGGPGAAAQKANTQANTQNTQATTTNTASQNTQTRTQTSATAAFVNATNANTSAVAQLTVAVVGLRGTLAAATFKSAAAATGKKPFGPGFRGGGTVKRFAGGGPVRRMQDGANVSGIRKDLRATVSTVNLDRGISKQGVGALTKGLNKKSTRTFGGAFLRPDGVKQNISGSVKAAALKGKGGQLFKSLKGSTDKNVNTAASALDKDLKFNLLLRGLNEPTSSRLEDTILENVIGGIDKGAGVLNRELGVKGKGGKVDARFLKQINIDNISGNIFEGILARIQGVPFEKDNANDPFDFARGLGTLAKAFDPVLQNIPTDARNTATTDSTRGFLTKVQQQVANEASANLNSLVSTKLQGVDTKNAAAVTTALGVPRTRGADIAGRLKFAEGGVAPGVKALLAPNELVFGPDAAKQAGIRGLQTFNATGDISSLGRFDQNDVQSVPGVGRGDNFPTTLPEGSFVIRADSAEGNNFGGGGKVRRKFGKGGSTKRFQNGSFNPTAGNTGKPVPVPAAFKAQQAAAKSADRLAVNLASLNNQLNRFGATGQQRAAAEQQVTRSIQSGVKARTAINAAIRSNTTAFQRLKAATATAVAGPVGGARGVGSAISQRFQRNPALAFGLLSAGPLAAQALGTESAGAAATGAAITGATSGAFLGASVGGVPGAVVGGLVGAIGAATSAYTDTAKKIRDAKLAESLEEFNEALQKFITNNENGEFSLGKALGDALEQSTLTREQEGSFSAGLDTSRLLISPITGLNRLLGEESGRKSREVESIVANQGIAPTLGAGIKIIGNFAPGSGFFPSFQEETIGQGLNDLQQLNRTTERDRLQTSFGQQREIIEKAVQAQFDRNGVTTFDEAINNLIRENNQEGGTLTRQDITAAFAASNNALVDSVLFTTNENIKKTLGESTEEERKFAKFFEATIAAKNELLELTTRADAFGLRLNATTNALAALEEAGGGARNQIAIAAGGAGRRNLSSFNQLEFTSSKDIGNVFDTARGRFGDLGVFNELESAITDLKTFQELAPQALLDFATAGIEDEKGPDQIARELVSTGAFKDLNPIIKAGFQEAVKGVLGNREGGNPASFETILQRDAPKLVDAIVNGPGKQILESGQKLSASLVKIENELLAAAGQAAQLRGKIAQRQDQILGRSLDNARRFDELSGTAESGSAARAAQLRTQRLVEAATGRTSIGATTDPNAIATELKRIQQELVEVVNAPGSVDETRQANLLTSQAELTKALGLLTDRTSELAAIEKDINDRLSQQEKSQALAEQLAFGAVDPKLGAELSRAVAGLVRFASGDFASDPEGARAGISLLRDVGALSGDVGTRAADDFVGSTLGTFLRGLDDPRGARGADLLIRDPRARTAAALGAFEPTVTAEATAGEAAVGVDKASLGLLSKGIKNLVDSQTRVIGELSKTLNRLKDAVKDIKIGDGPKPPKDIEDSNNRLVIALDALTGAIVGAAEGPKPKGSGFLTGIIAGAIGPGKNRGGFIRGPFRGNRDTVLTPTTPGEFVVPRGVAQSNPDAISSLMAGAPGFQAGGRIDRTELNRKKRIDSIAARRRRGIIRAAARAFGDPSTTSEEDLLRVGAIGPLDIDAEAIRSSVAAEISGSRQLSEQEILANRAKRRQSEVDARTAGADARGGSLNAGLSPSEIVVRRRTRLNTARVVADHRAGLAGRPIPFRAAPATSIDTTSIEVNRLRSEAAQLLNQVSRKGSITDAQKAAGRRIRSRLQILGLDDEARAFTNNARSALSGSAPTFDTSIPRTARAPAPSGPELPESLSRPPEAFSIGRAAELRGGPRQTRSSGLLDRLFKFQDGGNVPGVGRGDKVPALLEPGEFVVPSAIASRNRVFLEALRRGKVSGMQDGGFAGNAGGGGGIGGGFVNAIGRFATAAQGLVQAVNSLNNLAQVATALNQAAQNLARVNIPERIQLEAAPIQVNVVLNGAEALAQMEPSIQSLVASQINKALSRTVDGITGETLEQLPGEILA